ncbi:MAG: 5-formyltetrahydrofolate cyclo-ligase [Candidatus Bathyarchaeota archaeon]|nr:MAG: 5-formyltetrahydrofolate cyclo-ligase [Candidatus Bathyarchaeota archaeon]
MVYTVYDRKRELREEVWRLLEEEKVTRFPRPVRGRIPNFEGSEVASRRILGTEEFHAAEAAKVNPDYPQLEVRKGTLYAGKLLIMPSPRLRSGFLVLDPTKIPKRNCGRAATIRGAFQYGAQTDLDLPPVDLIVCGSVAVTEGGTRVGKGGGYSELEYAVLRELGLVEEETPIMTTVHELQFVEDAPIEEHDFSVDLIATPMRLVKADGPRIRPKGVLWDKLSEEKIERMPILKKLRQRSSAG